LRMVKSRVMQRRCPPTSQTARRTGRRWKSGAGGQRSGCVPRCGYRGKCVTRAYGRRSVRRAFEPYPNNRTLFSVRKARQSRAAPAEVRMHPYVRRACRRRYVVAARTTGRYINQNQRCSTQTSQQKNGERWKAVSVRVKGRWRMRPADVRRVRSQAGRIQQARWWGNSGGMKRETASHMSQRRSARTSKPN